MEDDPLLEHSNQLTHVIIEGFHPLHQHADELKRRKRQLPIRLSKSLSKHVTQVP
jgi:hypothetical protein